MAIDGFACGTPLFGAGAFNVVKFILSVMSIFFDTVFLIQHYCLYRSAWVNKASEKNMTLLQKTIAEEEAVNKSNLTEDNQVMGQPL
jgi:hypothetical protein